MALTIFIVVTLIFALRGYFLGMTGWLTRTLATLAAFYVAIFYHQHFVDDVRKVIPVETQIPIQAIIAGVGLFMATAVAVKLCSVLLGKAFILFVKKDPKAKMAPSNRYAGAVANGFVGVLFGLLIVWIVGILQASFFPQSIKKEDSFQVAVNELMMGVAQSYGLPALQKFGLEVADDGSGKLSIERITHHQLSDISSKTSQLMQQLGGAVDLPMANAKDSQTAKQGYQLLEREILSNQELQKMLPQAAQILSEMDTGQMAKLMQQAMSDAEKWRQNPELMAVLQDPEIAKLVERKDIQGLLNSEKFQQLSRSADQAGLGSLTDLLMTLDRTELSSNGGQ